MNGIRSFATASRDTAVGTAELLAQLEGFDPTAIVFFAAAQHDGGAIAWALKTRFGHASVAGCTSAGEFSERGTMTGGITGLALDATKAARCAVRLARYDQGGVERSLRESTAALATDLGLDSLRAADPQRYVGIVLFDGLSGSEEEANEVLGNVAPMLSFVGGSAGDDLEFKSTKVFVNLEEAAEGAALLLIDSAVPFFVGKTCSFEPTATSFRVTRADVENRVVYELDGKPVLEAYAAALGITPEQVDSNVFMSNPVGLMIDGEPWIRSPQQVTEDGGLKFYCNIQQGMKIRIMQSTDIVGDAQTALDSARKALGAPISGGLAFNCILRRLEMDAKNLHEPFLQKFEGMSVGGFHTYGETWLGHMNQTLTAVWFA